MQISKRSLLALGFIFISLFGIGKAEACEYSYCGSWSQQCASYDWVCNSYSNQCTGYTQVCTSYDEDGNCTSYSTECTSWQQVCDSYSYQCTSYHEVCDYLNYYYGETTTFRGSVKDGLNHPMQNVPVSVTDSQGNVQSARTDANGNYSTSFFVYDDASGNLSAKVCTQTQDGFMNDCKSVSTRDNQTCAGVTQNVSGFVLSNYSAGLPYSENFASAPNGPLAGKWNSVTGLFNVTSGVLSSYAGYSNPALAVLSHVSVGDVTLQADVDVTSSSRPSASLVARYAGNGDANMYIASVYQDSLNHFVIRITKNVGGTWTNLKTVAVPQGAGTLKFELLGSSLKAYWRGSLVTSATDSSLTSGFVGIRAWNANSKFSNFSVIAAESNVLGIFNNTFTPDVTAVSSSQSIEVGMKFRSDTDGYVSGVRFYKGAGNTGTHTGHLWDSMGNLLSSVTFVNETSSGWQTAFFPTLNQIRANQTYVISYHAPAGHYASNPYFFTTVNPFNFHLRGLGDGFDGPNGVYATGSSVVFPTQSSNGNNFWVDALFQTSKPIAPTPTNFTLSAASKSQINTSWKSAGGLTKGFMIKIQAGSYPASCSGGVNVGTATSKAFTGLIKNTTYYFKLCAYDSTGALSAPVSGSAKTKR